MPTGYVYELYSDEGTETYIGSSINVKNRFKAHKHRKINFENGEGEYCASFEILEMYGSNTKKRILEEVEYIDEDDTLLRQEEQKWIDMSKTCVNRNRAFIPDDWTDDYFKQKGQENYEKHKHKYLSQQKNKYYENHDENKEKMRQNYYANHQQKREKANEYYHKNREVMDALKAKDFVCECGCVVQNRNASRHRLSLKHQKWVALQNN
jgi:hypothetical protein